MGKMYTLKPDESINDHMKVSIDTISHIAELSISCMRDLSNPHEGTFVDMTYNEFMLALEHIRNTIEMLDELTDELEDREDEIRREYEEKVIRFFNRVMNADPTDDRFRELAISRNNELEQERERSNQLEERCSELVKDRDSVVEYWEERTRKLTIKFELAKKFFHQRRAEVSRLKEELRQTRLVKDAQKKVIDEKEKQISDLHHEIWELQEQAEYWEDLAKKYADPNGHNPNNPANFCGNCKYFNIHPNDVGTCENIYGRYSKYVDPDDASCQAFESNKPTVVIGKPEFPCCEHCSHEDCDDCALCPF